MIQPSIIYHIIHHGRGFKLVREGAYHATRVFPDGLSMSRAIGWYLLNRNVQMVIHKRDGSVLRIIDTDRTIPV